LEAIRSQATLGAVGDQHRYGKAPPPAHDILVASGTLEGQEILTFWAISFVMDEKSTININNNNNNEKQQQHQHQEGGAGFTLPAILQEAILMLEPWDLIVRCLPIALFGMNQWRHRRNVALKEQTKNIRPTTPQVLLPGDQDEEGHENNNHNATTSDDDNGPRKKTDRITTITNSAPIVAVQAIVGPLGGGGNDETGGSHYGGNDVTIGLEW
jgi:hypothetical protein